MQRALGTVGLLCTLVGCGGRSASNADTSPGGAGASANGNVAGTAGNAGAPNSAGASGAAVAAVAGSPSFGGAPAGGASEDSAGAAGVENSAGSSAVVDYERALWPIPNSVSSGLPHPASYDLSVPEVVTDNVTGLVWQRGASAPGLNLAEATSYCSELTLAGHDDWRLPSRMELVSLRAAADAKGVNENDFPISGQFLSSTQYTPPPELPGPQGAQVWVVDPSWADLIYAPVSSEQATAICVRSKQPVHAQPALVMTPDVVTDTFTGLIWQRTPPPVWASYTAAQAYCTDLSLGGFDDWRMPSMQEMLSISEPTLLWPSLDTSDFPGDYYVERGWFWSAPAHPTASSDNYASALNFGGLYTRSLEEAAPCLVRCVR